MEEQIEQRGGDDSTLWDAVLHLSCPGFGVIVFDVGLPAGYEIG